LPIDQAVAGKVEIFAGGKASDAGERWERCSWPFAGDRTFASRWAVEGAITGEVTPYQQGRSVFDWQLSAVSALIDAIQVSVKSGPTSAVRRLSYAVAFRMCDTNRAENSHLPI
jgi:hypothetical protein